MAKNIVIDTRYKAHASKHARGEDDEIDGDKLDIDYNPSGYTPDTSISEADSVDDLSAHLKGISDGFGLKGNSGIRTVEYTDIGTRAGLNLLTLLLPNFSVVTEVEIHVTTPITGTGANNDATATAGLVGDSDKYMEAVDIDLYTAGIYTVKCSDVMTSDINPVLQLVADTGTITDGVVRAIFHFHRFGS